MKHRPTTHRARLNLSLPSDLHAALAKLAEKGGFKNACRLLKSLSYAYVRYAIQEAEKPRKTPTVHDEVSEMFDEMLGAGLRSDVSIIAEVKRLDLDKIK